MNQIRKDWQLKTSEDQRILWEQHRNTFWEEIIATAIHDNRLLSRIHKKFLQINKKRTTWEGGKKDQKYE